MTTLQSAPPVELNHDRFIDLLTKLIGESETLQNSPLQGEGIFHCKPFLTAVWRHSLQVSFPEKTTHLSMCSMS
jgi:hypothetical protein